MLQPLGGKAGQIVKQYAFILVAVGAIAPVVAGVAVIMLPLFGKVGEVVKVIVQRSSVECGDAAWRHQENTIGDNLTLYAVTELACHVRLKY